MSQPHALNNFAIGSSRQPRTARTVLLRMAADQDRADRIRTLKTEHPEYTWQVIADRVGVSLRAAQSWQETGGIAYENAKKLAELWDEDLDYIMRGVRRGAGDLMGALNSETRDDRLERKLDALLAHFGLSLEEEPEETIERELEADDQSSSSPPGSSASGGRGRRKAGPGR